MMYVKKAYPTIAPIYIFCNTNHPQRMAKLMNITAA